MDFYRSAKSTKISLPLNLTGGTLAFSSFLKLFLKDSSNLSRSTANFLIRTSY